MDPIPSKQQVICPFAFNDKEGRKKGLRPDQQIHIYTALGVLRISSKIIQDYTC
jgi:hypothetical protein